MPISGSEIEKRIRAALPDARIARHIPVADLQAAYEGWFPTYMAGEIAA